MRRDGTDAQNVQAAKDEGAGNPTLHFRGHQRRNDTHPSTTDPESVLDRKGGGKEANLCFGGHILMDNRHGLCADLTIHDPIAEPEPVVAVRQIQNQQKLHEGVRVQTVGADKADHRKDFVPAWRQAHIAPQVACKEGLNVPGLGGRTTRRTAAG